MKKTQINLSARYAAAFGVASLVDVVKKELKPKKMYDVDYYQERSSDFEKVEFSISDNKSNYSEKLEFSSVLKGERGHIFAPPLMINFSQDKSLIETEVNDDDAVVIERWGTKPWNIEIKGLLIDLDNRIYPSDEIKRLNLIWKCNQVVEVAGLQFEERQIDAIYFKSIEFTPLEGFQDTIQFSLSANSIKSVAFTLSKPNITFSTGNLEITNEDGSQF